jgi:glycosyltransferase involved in cell wall biosynthesis
MISIIIPTFNRADYLDLTLASFTLQTLTDFELVIVNDGGQDHTDSIIQKYRRRLNIKYIRQGNRGRAAARNTAIAHAEGDIFIFNDDDRMVHPHFVAEHVKAIAKAEQIAVMGWKRSILTIWKKNRLPLTRPQLNSLLARNPNLINRLHTLDTLQLVYPEDLERDFHAVIAAHSFPESEASENFKDLVDTFSDDLTDFDLSWTIGTTANMSVHSAIIKAIRGFDEDYVGWGMEDTDLNYRLWRAGVRLKYCRTALNLHQLHPLGEGMVNHDRNQRDFQWYQNVMRFCEKYSNLEAFVFWNLCRRRKPDFVSANTLLRKLRSLDECVQNELLGTYRELFALSKQVT